MTPVTSSSEPGAAAEWTPRRIDALCDAFEEAIRCGQQPRLGDYVAQCSGPKSRKLFAELMLVELELCRNPGDESTYQHYRATYPEFADVIETVAFQHGLSTADPGVTPARSASEGDPTPVRSAGEGVSPTQYNSHASTPTSRLGDASDPRSRLGLVPEPRHVAHFFLQERLGAGSMGEVWRAWDARLKRTVAVKIPRSHDLSETELHRFLREGRAAAQLRHPNIVPVHEVGRDGSVAYIVSDFIEGRSLQELLDDGADDSFDLGEPSVSRTPKSPAGWENDTVSLLGVETGTTEEPAADSAPPSAHAMPPRRAAKWCAKLAEALHHAHEHGIVHRDLKPRNVLIGADGQPHIVDFGIAKWSGDTRQLTLDGYAVGTPAYMSPEQARGDSASVDRRADVYALGAILYRLLTGRVPFAGDSPAAVLRSVLDDTPRPPRAVRRDIPRDLETICLKAMEKDPARRYATARALEADLARFLRGDPIVGRRPGLLEKTARLVRKRPAAAAAVALGLVALGAVGVAAGLARQSALKGLVPVTLETNPPGARVVFVPLHGTTQEPQEEKAVRPWARSPVNVRLAPGEYLVVAALDDGRFHEVYRRVWRGLDEYPTSPIDGSIVSRGSLLLKKIEIPDASVTRGMARVDPEVQDAGRLTNGRPWAPFYIDVRETTCRDCLALGTMEVERKANLDQSMTVSYDRACLLAEKLGKRLPTAGEFLYAASLPKAKKCDPADATPVEFGPAGTPECDRVGEKVLIAGLHSNVAEWTTTALRLAEHNNTAFEHLNFPQISLHRIVKGGDMAVVEGNPSIAPEHRDPTGGFGILRHRTLPGLGFRCVRSASPRFLPKP